MKIILKQKNGVVLDICEIEDESYDEQEVNCDGTNQHDDVVNEESDVTDTERGDILATNGNQRDSPLKIVTIT